MIGRFVSGIQEKGEASALAQSQPIESATEKRISRCARGVDRRWSACEIPVVMGSRNHGAYNSKLGIARE